MDCREKECKENNINWVKTLPSKPCPNSIYFLKIEGGTLMYVSSITGVLTQIGGGGGSNTEIISLDSSITVEQQGQDFELQVSQILQDLINGALQEGDDITMLINNAGYITEAEIPPSSTNLSYTPSTTVGIVNSDTGTDASIPLADGINSGLSFENYSSSEKIKLAGIEVQATRLLLGENSNNAYRGDRGKIAYDHSQIIGNPHGTSKVDIGLGNVDNTSDVDKPVSNAQSIAINAKVSDNIIDGVTTVAPSQNAVFDSLVLKENISDKQQDLSVDGTGFKYPSVDAINNAKFSKIILFDNSTRPDILPTGYRMVATYNLPALPTRCVLRVTTRIDKVGTAGNMQVNCVINNIAGNYVINGNQTGATAISSTTGRHISVRDGVARSTMPSGSFSLDTASTANYTYPFNPTLTTNTMTLSVNILNAGDVGQFEYFMVELLY